MPTTNNNLLAEITTLVIGSLLILVGGFLLYFGKIDVALFIGFVGAALTLLGLKATLSAPSAVQQATLQSLLTSQQTLLANHQQLVSQMLNMQSAPASVAAPQVVQQPFNSAPSATFTYGVNPTGATSTTPGAMMTTQTYPAMPK